ncbi:hypothetical protein KC928_22445, partial [Enterobacter cloacae]
RLRFSGPKTSIIRTPTTSLKTSIKTITNLSDTNCLEIQGASLVDLQIMSYRYPGEDVIEECFYVTDRHLNQREIVQAKENLL